jgi:WhiB family redox-sensing transcriptional regulator
MDPRREDTMSLEWMDDALCREIDAELFFPENTTPSAARKACALCTVQTECLEYALQRPVMGVWGGTTEKERQRLRRMRAA